MRITREDLTRPGVRVLNLGGAVNPDVLLVFDRSGFPNVVKDYSMRSPRVRRWLAPWLVEREMALLSRVTGVQGVPRLIGRIDAEAFALEWLEGEPLRRRSHASALPASFFSALEATLEALRARGVFYTDLRSPTNVLCTPRRAPALIDLASAVRVRLPRPWSDAYYRRALAKLRRRFEAPAGAPFVLSATTVNAGAAVPAVRGLQMGRDRIMVLDVGAGRDPVPAIFIPEPRESLEQLREVLSAGAVYQRRGLGIELPGLAGSRAATLRDSVEPERHARWLAHALSALRIPQFDLIGFGWAGLVARALAQQSPERIRRLVTIDTPVDQLRGPFLRIWEASFATPEAFAAALVADRVNGEAGDARLGAADRAQRRRLQRAYREIETQSDASGAPRLVATDVPKVPWLAVERSADEAQLSHHGVGDGTLKRVTWPRAQMGELLWNELARN